MSAMLDVSKRQLQEEIEALRRTLDSPFAASHASSAAREVTSPRYASPTRAYITPVRSSPRVSPVRKSSPLRSAAYSSVSANLERAEREVEELGRRMHEVEREVRVQASLLRIRAAGGDRKGVWRRCG